MKTKLETESEFIDATARGGYLFTGSNDVGVKVRALGLRISISPWLRDDDTAVYVVEHDDGRDSHSRTTKYDRDRD